jgi:hypothetical protein
MEINIGDRVTLSQNCRHEYARGISGTVLKTIKARGGEVKVRLDSGKDYWANLENVRRKQ